MHKPLLLLLFCFCGFSGKTQSPFQKYYVQIGAWANMNIEVLSNGNLAIAIGGKSIMDGDGNFLHRRCYDVNPYTNIQSVRKHTENEYYFVGGVLADSCTVEPIMDVNPVFGKMDSLGNIMVLYHYLLNAESCYNVAYDLAITGNGDAVVWGNKDSFFALRVDQQGQPLWSKQYDRNGRIRFIKELPGGDLLAGFQTDTAGACVARLSANGDLLWCKSYMRDTGSMHDAVIHSDSSFVVTGYTGTTPRKLFTMLLNGDGDVQWCRGYDNGANAWDDNYPVRMVSTQDGNLTVLATLGQPGIIGFFRPYLMKLDQNGDTLWTRSVGAEDYIYNGISLMASPDGGFYYAGTCWGQFGQASGAVYLFKTDSLGHVPCHERVHPVGVVELFPTDSSFTLVAVEGAVAIAGSNSETPCPQGTVYDGCTLDPVRIPDMSARPPKVSVRPNPNAGRFTMAFRDPLMADSWYAVYDATGKLLFQRPLPAGQGTEEVDLSRYGSGTYVLRFTSPEEACFERVVVE